MNTIKVPIGDNSMGNFQKIRRPPCCVFKYSENKNELDGRSTIRKYSNQTICFINASMKPYR